MNPLLAIRQVFRTRRERALFGKFVASFGNIQYKVTTKVLELSWRQAMADAASIGDPARRSEVETRFTSLYYQSLAQLHMASMWGFV